MHFTMRLMVNVILTSFNRFVFIQGEKGEDCTAGSDGQPGIPVSLFHFILCVCLYFYFLFCFLSQF